MFKPGQCGNPGGRPKSALNKILAQYVMRREKGETHALRIAKQVVKLAESGDLDAAEFIWDRLEGKPLQSMDIKDERPPQRIDFSKVTTAELRKIAGLPT